MISRSQQVIDTIVGMIFDEAVKYEVPPERVLSKVRESLDNKMISIRAANPVNVAEMIQMIHKQLVSHPAPNCRHAVYALGEWNTAVQPEKIIYSGNRTIVFWNDGTKTIVKVAKGQEFDEYLGFIAAYAKKMFGTNSKIKKLIKALGSRPEHKKPKKSDETEN